MSKFYDEVIDDRYKHLVGLAKRVVENFYGEQFEFGDIAILNPKFDEIDEEKDKSPVKVSYKKFTKDDLMTLVKEGILDYDKKTKLYSINPSSPFVLHKEGFIPGSVGCCFGDPAFENPETYTHEDLIGCTIPGDED